MEKLPVRKNIRLKYYDYKQNGYYFVTICCYNFQPNLAKHKKLAEEILLSLSKRCLGLQIDYFVLMPTHIHIIFISEGCEARLGEVVRIYKALVTKETKIKNFWQRNYYEHVIRNESALIKIREYIQNNPEAQNIKFEKFYKPDDF